MRKQIMALVMVGLLLVGLPMAALAASGFTLGLGYNQLSTDTSLSLYDSEIVGINIPGQSYTLDLGYKFSDNFKIKAAYTWGKTDLIGILNDAITLDGDVQKWNVEAEYLWNLSKKAKLGLVGGYLNSTWTGNADFVIGTAELDQTYKGFYLGPVLTYAVTDRVEFGASYKWLLSPDGDIKVKAMGHTLYQADLNDISASTLELYLRAAINGNWGLKTNYKVNWLKYKVESTPVEISENSSGLGVMVEYRF